MDFFCIETIDSNGRTKYKQTIFITSPKVRMNRVTGLLNTITTTFA